MICDVQLELHVQVEVYGFNDRFTNLPIVRHLELQRADKWMIGLKFVCKWGK